MRRADWRDALFPAADLVATTTSSNGRPSKKERIVAKSGKGGPRVTVKMCSTESPYRFTTTKNKRNTPKRLELRRYDPVIRRHVLFREEK